MSQPQNKTFAPFLFLSSPRVMFWIGVTICAILLQGTFVEWRYNSELAILRVYDQLFFKAILGIFAVCVALSLLTRVPRRLSSWPLMTIHLGFLIFLTGGYAGHALGSFATVSLRPGESIEEADSQRLAISLTPRNGGLTRYYPVPRQQNPLSPWALARINRDSKDFFKVRQTRPFVVVGSQYEDGVDGFPAIKITLHDGENASTAWLQTRELARTTVGGVNFVFSDFKPESSPVRSQKIEITAVDSGRNLASLPVSALRSEAFANSDYRVRVLRFIEKGIVGENGLVTNPNGVKNPALEVEVVHAAKTDRAVLFLESPEANVHTDNIMGLRLRVVNTLLRSPASQPEEGAVELAFSDKQKAQIRVDVHDGPHLRTSWLREGEPLNLAPHQILTVDRIIPTGRETLTATSVLPRPHSTLPPSAVLLQLADAGKDGKFWLAEGHDRELQIGSEAFLISYGAMPLVFPFSVRLEENTSPAATLDPSDGGYGLAFSDDHEVWPVTIGQDIMHRDYRWLAQGFKDDEMQMSVYHDPGRPFKHLGAIMLLLGVAGFAVYGKRKTV